ncbi:MAG: DUF3047 domain-containing protein [Deltaproteobacteria bacterium]|nr:DUF3047 domain-containing protein [Deltaproteobacteria bacterium]
MVLVHGISLFAFSLVGLLASVARAQPLLPIDDFTQQAVGKYPHGWRTWPTQGGKAREVYTVAEEDGNRYLAANDTKDHSVQIFREFDWDPGRHPVLSWRWRARQLPAEANERSDATNDSACGVYVIFGKVAGRGLKYVWSTTLPPGTTRVKEANKMYFTVLDKGPATSWRAHKVHVLQEYQKFFGKAPEKAPVGIGILTDGNATHTPAACDYDDFTIGKE